jgi:hypothetical protein
MLTKLLNTDVPILMGRFRKRYRPRTITKTLCIYTHCKGEMLP